MQNLEFIMDDPAINNAGSKLPSSNFYFNEEAYSNEELGKVDLLNQIII